MHERDRHSHSVSWSRASVILEAVEVASECSDPITVYLRPDTRTPLIRISPGFILYSWIVLGDDSTANNNSNLVQLYYLDRSTRASKDHLLRKRKPPLVV